MNTYQILKLNNGQEVKLTLNLKRLLLLKSKDKDLYTAANRIITKGPDDIEDLLKILYTSYLCGLDSGIQEYSFDNFVDLITLNLYEIIEITNELIMPKKK